VEENNQGDKERGGNQNNVEQASGEQDELNKGYWVDAQSIIKTKKQEMSVVNKDFY